MPLCKEEKIKLISYYQEKITNAKAIVFTDYSGVKVVDLQDLRKKFHALEIEFRITKNTLLKKALNNAGIEIDESIFSRQLAASFDSIDEIAASKIISDKLKELENLKILGGIINGEFVGPEKILELAKLPSREELYAKVVGSIAAPISGLVNVLVGNLRGLINVLNQYKESKQ